MTGSASKVGYRRVRLTLALALAAARPVAAADVFMDAGGSGPTKDAKGRIWLPDASFLAPGHGPTQVADWPGETVDDGGLTDRAIPGAVLRSERWADGDLRYEVPVPDGEYTVVLYFSENCRPCVHTGLGGTAVGERLELSGSFLLGPAALGALLPRNVPIEFRLSFAVETAGRTSAPGLLRLEVSVEDAIVELRGDPAGYLED